MSKRQVGMSKRQVGMSIRQVDMSIRQDWRYIILSSIQDEVTCKDNISVDPRHTPSSAL
jgi:hypothetical protein